MTNLSAKVKTFGVAKNKILAVIICFMVILVSAVAFGVFTTEVDNKMVESETLDTYQDNPKNVDRVLDAILAKKQIASSNTTQSSVLASSTVIDLESVPPILKSGKEIILNENVVSNEESIYKAKSLLYSNVKNITTNNTDSSSPVSNVKTESINNDIDTNSNPQKQFMQDAKNKNTDYLFSNITKAQSPYEVKAGSIIPATMINGLNSDLPGQIIAQVRANIYDSITRRYLLIPQGAKLVGVYDNNIIYAQQRILVAWNRLIYPDGSSINLKAMPGTDLEGYAGFYDEVDNKYWKIFGSSFIMGVITGAMQYSQNNTNANVQVGGIGVTTNNNPTVAQTISGSLGQQLGQTGLAITQKNLNIQPTLIVKPNYPFNIMITADMILNPLPLK